MDNFEIFSEEKKNSLQTISIKMGDIIRLDKKEQYRYTLFFFLYGTTKSCSEYCKERNQL